MFYGGKMFEQVLTHCTMNNNESLVILNNVYSMRITKIVKWFEAVPVIKIVPSLRTIMAQRIRSMHGGNKKILCQFLSRLPTDLHDDIKIFAA